MSLAVLHCRNTNKTQIGKQPSAAIRRFLYGQMMVIAALAVFQFFSPPLVESKYFDAPVYGMAEDFFHIVEMRL